MSATGLGRVKTPCGKSVLGKGQSWASGHDRGDQRLDPDDVHDPCQVISQDRECHFSGYFWKRFGQEVCRPHAGLHCAERMLDGLTTLAHGERVRIPDDTDREHCRTWIYFPSGRLPFCWPTRSRRNGNPAICLAGGMTETPEARKPI
jgi:hypothetical protein